MSYEWMLAWLNQTERFFGRVGGCKFDDAHMFIIDRRVGNDDPQVFIEVFVRDEEGVSGIHGSISEDVLVGGLGDFLHSDDFDHIVLVLCPEDIL